MSAVISLCGKYRCLGMNKTGTPRHPLYVQKTRELEDFKG